MKEEEEEKNMMGMGPKMGVAYIVGKVVRAKTVKSRVQTLRIEGPQDGS